MRATVAARLFLLVSSASATVRSLPVRPFVKRQIARFAGKSWARSLHQATMRQFTTTTTHHHPLPPTHKPTANPLSLLWSLPDH